MRRVDDNNVSDHGPWTCSRKFQLSCCLHTVKYHYLVEGHKVYEYHTETDLLNVTGTKVVTGW